MNKRILLILLFVFIVQDLLAQCAMCKAVAEDAAEDAPSSINTGILYIMVIPYIILFFAFRKKIFGLLRELRKAKG